MRYGRLKDSFESIQYSVTDTFIEEIAVDYIYYLPRFNHLIDGAIAVLNYLNPKYNLHIITNGFAGIQERKLKNSNILNYFKTITNSDNAGVKKPNPIIFNFALQMANTSCENSIMIGDCIEADVDGALDAGYDAIFFNENNVQIPDGIKTIHHLLELKNYL